MTISRRAGEARGNAAAGEGKGQHALSSGKPGGSAKAEGKREDGQPVVPPNLGLLRVCGLPNFLLLEDGDEDVFSQQVCFVSAAMQVRGFAKCSRVGVGRYT